MQGEAADSVFFIEDGDCQVGYNQRRTADEDLISTVSTFCCGVPISSTCQAPVRMLVLLAQTSICISALLLAVSAVAQDTVESGHL